MEHSVSAHGNSLDGHHLRETVRDGNSGQTRVLREVRIEQCNTYQHSFYNCCCNWLPERVTISCCSMMGGHFAALRSVQEGVCWIHQKAFREKLGL